MLQNMYNFENGSVDILYLSNIAIYLSNNGYNYKIILYS